MAQAAPPDMLAPIDATGAFLPGPLVPIDKAHRSAMLHRGVWLHVLCDDDESLLLVQRSATMKTCPRALSIIGEHHSGRESDEACARRALREELPGLVAAYGTRLELLPLRPVPRWFLFDYPGEPRRHDRCLIVEYAVRVPANATTALMSIRGGHDREYYEHEATEMNFWPLPTVARLLRREPERFCAPELLPAALLDTLADLGRALRRPRAWHQQLQGGRNAMPERYEPTAVVRAVGARPSRGGALREKRRG